MWKTWQGRYATSHCMPCHHRARSHPRPRRITSVAPYCGAGRTWQLLCVRSQVVDGSDHRRPGLMPPCCVYVRHRSRPRARCDQLLAAAPTSLCCGSRCRSRMRVDWSGTWTARRSRHCWARRSHTPRKLFGASSHAQARACRRPSCKHGQASRTRRVDFGSSCTGPTPLRKTRRFAAQLLDPRHPVLRTRLQMPHPWGFSTATRTVTFSMCGMGAMRSCTLCWCLRQAQMACWLAPSATDTQWWTRVGLCVFQARRTWTPLTAQWFRALT